MQLTLAMFAWELQRVSCEVDAVEWRGDGPRLDLRGKRSRTMFVQGVSPSQSLETPIVQDAPVKTASAFPYISSFTKARVLLRLTARNPRNLSDCSDPYLSSTCWLKGNS